MPDGAPPPGAERASSNANRRGAVNLAFRQAWGDYAGAMARIPFIELGQGRDMTRIPILYEDRSVLAIDKPAGWMLAPFSWQRTQRNLPAALASSLAAGDFWAKCRNLKFLRHIHRLDADTSGILLLVKSMGAVEIYSDLFESRRMHKTYLAVVHGVPKSPVWTCRAKLAPDPGQFGRMKVDPRNGKEAETAFRVLETAGDRSLLEAKPMTGRTHQIRVHLREARHPVVGDDLYGPRGPAGEMESRGRRRFPLGLRAIELSYEDPFLRKPVRIEAPAREFLKAFGLSPKSEAGL